MRASGIAKHSWADRRSIARSPVKTMESETAGRRPAVRRRAETGLCALGMLLSAALGTAAPSPLRAVNRASHPRVLHTIRAIRSLKLDPTKPGPALHVRGVITYYDSATPNLFVQDGTAGIWVDLRGLNEAAPRPGQLVDMTGVVGVGFTPYIARPRWTVMGKSAPPRPVPLSYAAASTGAFDSQWVEMRGVVRSFVLQAEGNVLVMDVASPMGSFKVRVPDYVAPFPLSLVDAEVRFRGVASSAFNTRNQLIAMHLMMPSLAHIKVLRPAPSDPFGISVSPVSSLRRFTSDLPDVHRVKVLGVVTERYPGQGLFLMDATGGVYVESQDGAPVHPGDEVEILGFPDVGSYSPVLKSGSIRPTGKHVALRAIPVTGKTALRGGYDAQLVSITGIVRSLRMAAGAPVLDLQTPDNVSFETSGANAKMTFGHIPPGSTVRVTGVCSIRADDNGNPVEFKVVLRGSSDLVVLSRPPWFARRSAGFLFAALCPLLCAVCAWSLMLRRQVRRHTQTIKIRLESEAALEARYQRVFERNIAGLFIVEMNGTIIDCNEACAHILGFGDRQELLNARGEAELILGQFCKTSDEGESLPNAEHCFRRRDGSMAWALGNARVVRNGHAVIEGALIDITDRKLADERVEFLAYYDALTGLPNRALMQDRLARSLAAAGDSERKVALLFLDIDHFKTINDSLGHTLGDQLLEKIARALEPYAQGSDTVARLGGDEFLIALTSLQSRQEAGAIAERVCSRIREGFEVQGQMLTVSCSVGISIYPDHGTTAEALIQNADAAMNFSKEAGRNTYRFFCAQMTEQAVERLTLENNLRTGLEQRQFSLVFQPEVDLTHGSIVCCEALLRWNHPDAGMIPPDRFIPVAESTGMIIPLGEWVMRTACAEAVHWQRSGMGELPVAINVSARQLHEENFCDLVRNILEDTGLSPQSVELELTESVLASNPALIRRVFEELRAMGVGIAIDDFGTGYSSLSYLKQFPVTKLKIDRSFIREIDSKADDAAITQAIIHMAQQLGIRVIAEGVETEAQLARLRTMGCDEAQGYLISKPLTTEHVHTRIRENSAQANRPEMCAGGTSGLAGGADAGGLDRVPGTMAVR